MDALKDIDGIIVAAAIHILEEDGKVSQVAALTAVGRRGAQGSSFKQPSKISPTSIEYGKKEPPSRGGCDENVDDLDDIDGVDGLTSPGMRLFIVACLHLLTFDGTMHSATATAGCLFARPHVTYKKWRIPK